MSSEEDDEYSSMDEEVSSRVLRVDNEHLCRLEA